MSAARFVSLLLVAFFSGGCDVQNSSDVGCLDGDCEASCLAKGLPGGACEPSGCVCAAPDTDPYEWPEASKGTGGRRGADSDTGSREAPLDTETDEQTDGGTGSGPGTDSATDAQPDSESLFDTGDIIDTSMDTGTMDSETAASSTDDTTSA